MVEQRKKTAGYGQQGWRSGLLCVMVFRNQRGQRWDGYLWFERWMALRVWQRRSTETVKELD
jgi:hypothetical protein